MDNHDHTLRMAERMRGERILTDWWMEVAATEVEACVPKAIEYGAGDLEAIGRDMRMTGTSAEGETPDDELGVYFYIVGKVARWRSALERGERVSDDTLHDIGVYVRMAQRIRVAGGWPGIPDRVITNTDIDAGTITARIDHPFLPGSPVKRHCCDTFEGTSHLRQCHTNIEQVRNP